MVPRLIRMLKGYFLDTHLCIREAARVCRKGARLAFVVGNAQYFGECIPVDRAKPPASVAIVAINHREDGRVLYDSRSHPQFTYRD